MNVYKAGTSAMKMVYVVCKGGIIKAQNLISMPVTPTLFCYIGNNFIMKPIFFQKLKREILIRTHVSSSNNSQFDKLSLDSICFTGAIDPDNTF